MNAFAALNPRALQQAGESEAPWTFAFNLTRQPAISVPVGLDAQGMPRAVQVAAALYRDDPCLRAARALEAVHFSQTGTKVRRSQQG